MKQNKGVISLGLILAIVLGVVVVGGGAYYLGKSGEKNEVKVEENNIQIDQDLNKVGILSYKTSCDIANISKQSFSFNYPEGYTIKDIKPEEGNVPLSGVIQITIQPKDNSIPITIGPGFDSCEYTGLKLCKNIGGIYRLSTSNNSSESELAYNKILSTIKTGTDCKNSSGDLVQINSEKKDVPVVNNKIENNWLKSPKLGLYYQDKLNIIEYYVDKYGKQVDRMDGMSVFYGYWGYKQDSGLVWGGNDQITNPTVYGGGAACMSEADFGGFKYGISDVTCLRGKVTRVFHVSAKNKVTQEDLNIFGDFVLKNR